MTPASRGGSERRARGRPVLPALPAHRSICPRVPSPVSRPCCAGATRPGGHPARRLHPGPRGERPDRAGRSLGARRSLPAGRRLAAPGPRLTVSINVSARQLDRDQIVEDVSDALTTSGFDPPRAVLELTETTLMHNVEETVGRLTCSRRSGCASPSTTSAPATRHWPICGSSPSTCSRSTGPSSRG